MNGGEGYESIFVGVLEVILFIEDILSLVYWSVGVNLFGLGYVYVCVCFYGNLR